MDNRNIPEFPHEVVLNILNCLGQKDIVRAQLVCKAWYGYAQVARKQIFLRRWGFTSLTLEPRTPSLYETIPESSIVRRHCVGRSDTVPQLAFRYGVEPAQLLRLNNLMGPHLLQHRQEVYVPVPDLQQLCGCSAAFEYSTLLCRDLLVAIPPPDDADEGSRGRAGGCGGRAGSAAQRPARSSRMLVREMQGHVRRLLRSPDAGGGAGGAAAARRHAAAGAGGARGGGVELAATAAAASVDLASARFYLAEAGGCAQRAAQLFVEDLVWDRQGGGGGDPGTDTDDPGDSEATALIRMLAASDQHRDRDRAQRGQVGGDLASRDLAEGDRDRRARRRRWRQRLLRALLLLPGAACCCGVHRME